MCDTVINGFIAGDFAGTYHNLGRGHLAYFLLVGMNEPPRLAYRTSTSRFQQPPVTIGNRLISPTKNPAQPSASSYHQPLLPPLLEYSQPHNSTHNVLEAVPNNPRRRQLDLALLPPTFLINLHCLPNLLLRSPTNHIQAPHRQLLGTNCRHAGRTSARTRFSTPAWARCSHPTGAMSSRLRVWFHRGIRRGRWCRYAN